MDPYPLLAGELERLPQLEREHVSILEAAGEGIYGLDRDGCAPIKVDGEIQGAVRGG